MGRPAKITYEQVVAAAEAMISETGSYTLDGVRQRLGNQGGGGTIHKHLTTWRSMNPKPAAPVAELPQEVTRALNNWATQTATAARAHSEEQLLSEQGNSNSLADENQRLEDLRDALREEIADLVRERDQAQATSAERQKEIDRLLGEVDRERTLAGKAQTEAAEARLEVKSNAQYLAETKAEVGRLGGLLDAEREALSKARTDAAVFDAELKNARHDAEAERLRADGLQKRLDQAHEADARLRDELGQQLQQVAALTAALEASKAAVLETVERLKRLQEQLDQAHTDSSAMHAADQARIDRLEEARRTEVAEARAEADKARREAQADADKARREAQEALLQVADLRGKLVLAEAKANRPDKTEQQAKK